MANQTPQQYFYSLRIRYAGIAILFALIILISAALAYYTLNTTRHNTRNSIEDRQQLLLHTRRIHDAVWQAHEHLQLFLFNPDQDLYQGKIHKSIQEAMIHTEYLLKHNDNMTSNPQDSIKQLKNLLPGLDTAIHRLIQTRITAVDQYPSLKLAIETMLDLNTNFVTAASLAIDESSTSRISSQHAEIYRILIQTRHYWTQMISNFRMYLANRLGTFDNTVFKSQTNTIEIQYSGLRQQLDSLQQFDEKNQLDLQASSSLKTMLNTSALWIQEYQKVKKINKSDAWRTDALLMSNEVKPLLDQLWHLLLNIDLSTERAAEEDVGLLTRIAQYQLYSLWLAAALALFFVIISYLLLDKSLLQPLSMLTGALKAEASGHKAYALPTVKTRETQDLVDAFSEMRKQIHHRQTALEYQALHDSLTGLANRTLLMDRLQQGIQNCTRHKTSLSLLIIDLDGFKEVNDTLGHQVGDRLLEEVASRLTQTLREIDTVARLGGDEFAIILPENNETKAAEVAQKIRHILDNEYQLHGIQLYVSASIGIATHPKHTCDVQDLIKFADIAMYVAKRNKLGFAVYDSKHDTHSLSQLALGSDLRNALGSDIIQLAYQPKLDAQTRDVVGVEALFRWIHPKLGAISAAEAIDLAEQTGFINQLTMWTTEEVVRQQIRWNQAGIHLPVSINLSTYSLQSDTVIDYILAQIKSSTIDASKFIFEITESAMMVDPQHVIENIKHINNLGAQLSIDDFGTGFSSLSYMKKMPISELKIDKSFVIDMLENDNDAIIVRSIIDLAHNIGLKVVAKGVEKKATWQLLQVLGCDTVQGNYFCPPVSPGEFVDWYRTDHQDEKNFMEIIS